MININSINEVYIQFKKDINVNVTLPELLVLPKRNQVGIAQIDNVIPDFAEVFLGNKFFDNSINKKYLIIVLYHEFTHILDRVILLSHIKNSKEQRNKLFPYTEFHAAQIEMKKRLELFHNQEKKIRVSTQLYDEKDIISLQNFLEIELNQFELYLNELEQTPNFENVCNVIYIIIYNIGYYSVCKQFNIDDNLFLQMDCIPYVKNDLINLRNILLNIDVPSNEICMKTHQIVNKIVHNICLNYKLK